MVNKIFVNRKGELDRLGSYLETAKKGSPTFVFISGEAGVGKDFLVQHFIEKHSKDIVTFSYGVSVEDKSQPYKPFIVILDKFSSMDEKDLGEDATARLTSLRGMLESDTSMVGDLAKEREMLLETFTKFFEAVARDRTLCLYIDNLQWCDEASVMLVQELAMEMQECSLLLIMNFRPEELEEGDETVHPITGLMATLMMQDKLNNVLVERFGEDVTTDLVGRLIGLKDVPRELLDFIMEETEGSPLFIVELVESMLEQGLIDTSDPNWLMNLDFTRVRTPGGVKEIISRRLDHVDEEMRELLKTASVLGSKLKINDLVELTGKDKGVLSEAMSEAITRQIVFEDLDSAEETYGFDHSKIRDVLYESLPKARRKELHLKVGAMLEMRNRPLEYAYSMANHFLKGKDFVRAYRYAKLSGELSYGSHAPKEAFKHFTDALELLDALEEIDDKERERVKMLNTIGKVGYITGEWSWSISSFEEAIKLSEEIGDAQLLVASQVELGSILAFKGEAYHKAVELFTEALVIAEEKGFETEFASAQLGLGYVLWREGHYDLSEKHFNECLRMAEKLGDRKMVGETYVNLGNLSAGRGDFDAAMKYYNDSIVILEEVDFLSQLARAYNNLGDVYLKLKDWDMAIDYFDKCIATSEKISYKNMKAWAQFNMAEGLAKKGELDKALEMCSKALNLFYKMDDKSGASGAEKNMGIIYRFMKEWDKSEEHFNISVEMLREMNNLEFLIESNIELGEMFIDKGDLEKARAVLEDALKMSVEIEAKEYERRAKGIMERIEG